MIYLLNSPVLTGYGEWQFEGPLTLEQGRALLRGGFTSAIGHQGAADFLSALLGVTIPVNRIRIEMQPDDSALVVRILARMPEGKVLSNEEMKEIAHELGVLTRLT
ncbi:MAG: YddF family protein [bacterium]